MDRLLVASEYTDPALHVKELKAKLREEHKTNPNFGLLLITKDVESIIPVMELTDILEIPTILHATITGLAKTTLEPNVPSYDHNIWAIEQVMDIKAEKQEVVLRVDPLIPDHSNFTEINHIVHMCSTLGVKRCRTSVIDYYPFVIKKMNDAGYMSSLGFQAPRDIIQSNLDKMDAICVRYGMQMETCAEQYGRQRGCADRYDWTKFELDIPLATGKKQRSSCFCNIPKHDLLKGKPCTHNCLYCYWGKYK